MINEWKGVDHAPTVCRIRVWIQTDAPVSEYAVPTQNFWIELARSIDHARSKYMALRDYRQSLQRTEDEMTNYKCVKCGEEVSKEEFDARYEALCKQGNMVVMCETCRTWNLSHYEQAADAGFDTWEDYRGEK